jgi:cell division septal protein FtsQ
MNEEQRGGTRKRTVRPHQEMVQPATWAERDERRARYRSQQGQQYTAGRMVRRTFLQTGAAAPEGRVRPDLRPLPPMRAGIPMRSGQHRRKRSLWRRFLALFAVLMLVGVAGGFAIFSPSFRVRSVVVSGTSNPTLIRSIEQMGMQGQNIFLIDLTGMTNRIDAIPLVNSASIEKAWPDQLTVNVVERLPVLLWQANGMTYSVDRQGVVIGLASEIAGTSQLMTVVDARGKQAGSVQPGMHLNAADIAFALQVFQRLPQVANVTSFTLKYSTPLSPLDSGSFIVVSPQGWLAYLGSADDSNPLDNRLLELSQILNRAQQNQLNLATIDLRYGLRPVFTVKPS